MIYKKESEVNIISLAGGIGVVMIFFGLLNQYQKDSFFDGLIAIGGTLFFISFFISFVVGFVLPKKNKKDQSIKEFVLENNVKKIELFEKVDLIKKDNTQYSYKNFQNDLEVMLHKAPTKPYERQGEGLVHFVDVINKKNLPDKYKAEFIVWLSLMVMIDLVFFTYFKEYYLDLKKELKTPKFEYGLTNTFIKPESILLKMRRGVHIDEVNKSFKKIVPELYKILRPFLKKNKLDLEKVEEIIFRDEDIMKGLFGLLLAGALGKNLKELFETTTDNNFGGIKVFKSKE